MAEIPSGPGVEFLKKLISKRPKLLRKRKDKSVERLKDFVKEKLGIEDSKTEWRITVKPTPDIQVRLKFTTVGEKLDDVILGLLEICTTLSYGIGEIFIEENETD
nr:hypothetical protein [Candidatus Freyarchaeota archaeon]